MNYFELFGIPLSFQVDVAELRQIYFRLSRSYHPDFYTLSQEDKQSQMLELSTQVNKAYHVLSDPDRRLEYILRLLGHLPEGQEYKMDPEFLMEMMEFNEQILDTDLGHDPERTERLLNDLKQYYSQFEAEVDHLLHLKDLTEINQDDWKKLVEYYYKKRYLLRLQEQIITKE